MDLPFTLTRIAPAHPQFADGHIISMLDKCGFFLCQRGWARLLSDGVERVIRPGDIYIYVTSQVVRLVSHAPDTCGLLVEADVSYALPFVNRVLNPQSILFMRSHPAVALPAQDQQRIEQAAARIAAYIEEPPRADRMAQEIAKSMGQTLTLQVLDIYFAAQPYTPAPQTGKEAVFQRFLLDLFRLYRRQREVSFYASRQGLSPRYFSSVVRECSGHSALQWIWQLVIADAQQMLETTPLTIKEISARLHFPSQSFFGKYFKQYTGQSPSSYRWESRRVDG